MNIELEKEDARDLKQIEASYGKALRNIRTLLKALDNTEDLKQEFKRSLIEYIIGV